MAIVRLDKVQSKKYGNLESVKHSANLTNGLFFHVGALVAGERELKEVAVPSTTTFEKAEVVLHASPEVMYDPRKGGLKDYVLEAGEAGRAYHLVPGDIVTLTSDLFTAAPTVGQYVVTDGSGSMKLAPSTDGTQVISTVTYTPRFKAKVIEQTTLGYDGTTAYAIQVEKA
jgi:hypothetical protein